MAVDVQSGMLRRAQEKVAAAKINNVQFLEAALGHGKIERARFDRALLVTVLGELPNQELALQEIFDSLKPGGILSVTEIIFDNHYQRRGTVLRLAKACGFREKIFFGNRIAFTLHLQKPAVT